MLIQQLSQQQTDTLMKSLNGVYFNNWFNAFHEERSLPRTGLVALPEGKRTYFLIESYMVGINCGNSTALSLSSFARVVSTRPAGSCAMCLKDLFEKRFFPICRQQGKTQIVAKLEPDGVRVFKELQSLMPGIQLTSGFYWDAFVTVAPFQS